MCVCTADDVYNHHFVIRYQKVEQNFELEVSRHSIHGRDLINLMRELNLASCYFIETVQNNILPVFLTQFTLRESVIGG